MIKKNDNYDRRGQIWIETVLYTMIALALIGLVLGFVMPKINQTKDKLVIDQTIDLLTQLDDKISGAGSAVGSARVFDFTMKRGELYINSSSDKIVFEIKDLTKLYSEAGATIVSGPVKIVSFVEQKKNSVSLTLDYSGKYNLTYGGVEVEKKFSSGSTAYKMKIENKGISNLISIDLSI